MQVSDIIAKKPYLIWYTKSYSKLSDRAVLEAVLNYGHWEDVNKFLQIKGKKETARIFFDSLKSMRSNYPPQISNFFSKYFAKFL